MTTLVLRPLDTFFFRDGRPYNQDDPGQVEAASLFPPYPPTVVGAVRAAAARAMGPGSAWDTAALGDGVDWQAGDEALGPLRFSGPYILRNCEPLYPAPLNLVVGKDEGGADLITYLAPSSPAFDTDVGAVRLPAPIKAGRGFKTLEGLWINGTAMAQVLSEQPFGPDWKVVSEILRAPDKFCEASVRPNWIAPQHCLWQPESRVGVERDRQTRTTKRFEQKDDEPARGALYATVHVRPAPDVTLAVKVEALPDLAPGGSLAPLGGEGRSVWIERQDNKILLPQASNLVPDKDGVLRYTVVLITPADLGGKWPGPGEHLAGPTGGALPGKIVSGCTGRAIAVGGWDGAAHGPLPLRPLIPAGSVWFLEARADDAEAAQSWHGRAIGRSTGWGFGHVLIGRWTPAGEET
jgi:CRISPR-associated protein Cmr3